MNYAIKILKKLYHSSKNFLKYRPRIQLSNIKLKELGTNGCSFSVAIDLLPAKPLVYSFGVGENVSFDLELIDKYKAEIYAFDPTPKSIKWVNNNLNNEHFHFSAYGLSDKDAEEKFYLPKNTEYVSGSVHLRQELREDYINVPMKRLITIMQEFGHSYIDILKMDIEGSEFDAINDILSSGIQFGQLCVEVHDRFYKDGSKKLKHMILALNESGFYIASVSNRCEELTFIKRS